MSTAVSSEPRKSFLPAGWLNTIGPILALLLIFGIFSILVPDRKFPTQANIEKILRQSTIVSLAAIGMTIIIISGGIDLSCGSAIALCTVTTALTLKAGYNPWLASCVAILTGTLCGLLNGSLVVGLRVVPFIITLGTLLIFRGTAKGVAGESGRVVPDSLGWIGEILATLDQSERWKLFPVGVWAMILLAIAASLILRYTRFGRHVFALGSNEQTARLCGIGVQFTKFKVYALAGFFTGIAGLMQFSRLNEGDANVASGLELNVIAAVVIGGGSLSGGEGTILGSIVGSLIIMVINSGCTQMGIPNLVQEIVTGMIIIAAVALDRLRHRRAI